ncbi:MAG: ribosomal protein S18-alanine N-acetyltransferase [Candidatus Aminicenantes bacterium]
MEEKDLSSVCAIEKASFPNPWYKTTFIGEIHNRPISFAYVIVHQRANIILGYVILWHIKEGFQISNIAIHPDFRRRGIGEAVMQEVMDRMRREEAKFVTLEVRLSNTAALNMYKKLGFEILGIRKNYYHHPREHALLMGRSLTEASSNP